MIKRPKFDEKKIHLLLFRRRPGQLCDDQGSRAEGEGEGTTGGAEATDGECKSGSSDHKDGPNQSLGRENFLAPGRKVVLIFKTHFSPNWGFCQAHNSLPFIGPMLSLIQFYQKSSPTRPIRVGHRPKVQNHLLGQSSLFRTNTIYLLYK